MGGRRNEEVVMIEIEVKLSRSVWFAYRLERWHSSNYLGILMVEA
jgi:hypothetical protein